jgi:hypothetical protein
MALRLLDYPYTLLTTHHAETVVTKPTPSLGSMVSYAVHPALKSHFQLVCRMYCTNMPITSRTGVFILHSKVLLPVNRINSRVLPYSPPGQAPMTASRTGRISPVGLLDSADAVTPSRQRTRSLANLGPTTPLTLFDR